MRYILRYIFFKRLPCKTTILLIKKKNDKKHNTRLYASYGFLISRNSQRKCTQTGESNQLTWYNCAIWDVRFWTNTWWFESYLRGSIRVCLDTGFLPRVYTRFVRFIWTSGALNKTRHKTKAREHDERVNTGTFDDSEINVVWQVCVYEQSGSYDDVRHLLFEIDVCVYEHWFLNSFNIQSMFKFRQLVEKTQRRFESPALLHCSTVYICYIFLYVIIILVM